MRVDVINLTFTYLVDAKLVNYEIRESCGRVKCRVGAGSACRCVTIKKKKKMMREIASVDVIKLTGDSGKDHTGHGTRVFRKYRCLPFG